MMPELCKAMHATILVTSIDLLRMPEQLSWEKVGSYDLTYY
uniref:Uncharacterized protein n=1 Tax=Anguilla anguilla TaxID=7936 RepID=A0A0E9ULP5_ANGAN